MGSVRRTLEEREREEHLRLRAPVPAAGEVALARRKGLPSGGAGLHRPERLSNVASNQVTAANCERIIGAKMKKFSALTGLAHHHESSTVSAKPPNSHSNTGTPMHASSIKSRFGILGAGARRSSPGSAPVPTPSTDDRPPFTPPPDASSGFLGFFDAATQQTNCGNCHVEHQADWEGTKHADAWANLQALAQPADKSSCVGCHTVSENGNLATGPAGYLKVAGRGVS